MPPYRGSIGIRRMPEIISALFGNMRTKIENTVRYLCIDAYCYTLHRESIGR